MKTKARLLPDQAKLKEIFDYDPETGVLRWKSRTSLKYRIGEVAGSNHNAGYRIVCVRYKTFLAHRLIWKLVHGEDPPHQIDHINGNRSDNRIANLRSATHAENLHNHSASKNNACGIKGVNWAAHAKKWRAEIMVNRKAFHLGYFKEISDAANAYREAAERLHGEFAKL